MKFTIMFFWEFNNKYQWGLMLGFMCTRDNYCTKVFSYTLHINLILVNIMIHFEKKKSKSLQQRELTQKIEAEKFRKNNRGVS